MIGNILGKRDLSSRRGEIATSVIGKSGRVHQILVVDVEEPEARKRRILDKTNSFTKIYPEALRAGSDLISDKTVGSVQETEPAVYYAPYRPIGKSRKPNIGRQAHFWTAINGLYISKVAGIDNLSALPFCVRLEFIQRKFLLRGLVVTSWEKGSEAATVTPHAVPVAKAGTVMIHPMYPTSILAGDAVVITFPSDEEIRNAVDTPNREPEKLLCAYKSMREIQAIHNDAIKEVIKAAKKIATYPIVNGKYTDVPVAAQKPTELEKYTCLIMNVTDEKLKVYEETTTPFKLLWQAMRQYHIIAVATDYATRVAGGGAIVPDQTKGRLEANLGSSFKFVETCVENMMNSQLSVNEAFSERRQMLFANQAGVAITSGNQGQPIDMIIGRGQSL